MTNPPGDSPSRLEVIRAIFLAELASVAEILGRRKTAEALLGRHLNSKG